MKRHAAGHIHAPDSKRRRLPAYPKNGRVSQACKTCAASKLKCDEEKPCRRCGEKHLVCDWAQDGSSIDAFPQPQRHGVCARVIQLTRFTD
jgi:hypothetical protein